MIDPEDGQRFIEIRGEVVDSTETNGDEVIDTLARKYLGVDSYPWRNAAETRVTFLIEPTNIVVSG